MPKKKEPTTFEEKKPSAPKKKYEYERVTFMWNGKQQEAKGKTLKEAHAKAAKKKLALENGDVGTSGKMTVSRWADEWLETYKEPSVGGGSYKNYRLHLSVIKSEIGAKQLKDVKDIDLQKILNQRAYDKTREKPRSRSDLSKLRMTMRAMFKRARISRLIPYAPAENLELPAAKDGTRRSITEAGRKAILKLAETHHAGLWVKMMLYCGLRPGETRALDWRHIDFEKKMVHVDKAMKAHTTIIDDPKTPSGVRDIPLREPFLSDLKVAKKAAFDPVFTQPTTGKRHTEESMRCLWENFIRNLDISCGAKLYRSKIIISAIAPDLVPYCLRHTYGTDLQDYGVPINLAKYLMGHSDISVTANIYTHTTEKAIQEVADKINRKSVQ